jgi:hypothetical protein
MNKTDQTLKQKAEEKVASYAINYAENIFCAAVRTAADDVPVCGIVKFFSSLTSDFWDVT